MAHSFITISRREDVSLLSEAHVSKWINNKLQPLNLRIYNEMFDCLAYRYCMKTLHFLFSSLFIPNDYWKQAQYLFFRFKLFFLFSLSFFLPFYGYKKNISENNNNNNVTASNENTMEFIKASENFSNILWVCNIQKRNKKMKNDHTNQTYHIFSYMYNS